MMDAGEEGKPSMNEEGLNENGVQEKEEAIEAARAVLVNEVGEEQAETFYIDYAHRHLRYSGTIFEAVYIYKIEFENPFGNEFEIEVSAQSGYAVITDIDF